MNSPDRSLPVLLTLGEPAGIGPDCVLRAWEHDPTAFRDVVVVAPESWLLERAAMLGIEIQLDSQRELGLPSPGATLTLWNPLTHSSAPVVPGIPSQDTALAVIECIRQAAHACIGHRARALVTGPIEKAVLRDAGFAFPGHTEFLAHLAGNRPFAMMLASEQLRVALLTTHVALCAVSDALRAAPIGEIIQVVDRDLRNRFGIQDPRLALCALNPHAGEGGHFGCEEQTILAPAVAEARLDGIDIEGPLSADTLFAPHVRKRFDAIICCYHDQALIPLKAISFGEAVNVTLGLPFVRTSVDHGTALDRVGRPEVDPGSLLAAIAMARRLTEAPA